MARVFPTEEAMDETLASELASGSACALGDREHTWEGLVDEISGGARPLDPVTERLALRLAAARVVSDEAAASRGFLGSAARALGELRRAGVRGVPPAAPLGARAARVLALLGETARLHRTIGAAPRDARRADAVAAGVRTPAALLEIEPRLVWEPADVDLLLALARRARVRVRLPWAPGRAAIYAGIDDVLARLEAGGVASQVDLELVLEDPAERGCAQGLVAALYRPGSEAPAPRGQSTVVVLSAPHPAAEARALAARVRVLLDGGVAPEEIALATRQGGAGSELYALELERAGIPVDDRASVPLSATPPARLVLGLLTLPDRGFPREDTLAILGSAYVGTEVDVATTARLARSLGVRELGPRGDGLRRLAGASPVELSAPVAHALRLALAPLADHPAEATVADHARALRRTLDALGVRAAATGGRERGSPHAVERAVARDGQAIRLLDELLVRLPAAAAQAGHERVLSRRGFAALLADLLGEQRLRPGGPRGGAVRLVLLEDLAGRSFDHIFVPQLVDGTAPARAQDDGVWGDRERRQVNAALGRRVLATLPGRDDGEPTAPERTGFETLLLVNAAAAARHGLVLSYPRTAGDRPLDRSAFVDEVIRAAPWVPQLEIALSPVPPLSAAAAPSDVLAAVALEALGDPEGRVPPRPRAPDADVLLDDLARVLPERVARLVELAGIEAPGPYVGVAGPLAAARAGGGPEKPIPARQLELLAGCGFTYLAGRVLGAQQVEQTDDAPTPQSLGRLAHRCLEVFYRRRAADGALPIRGGAGDRAALDEACAEVFRVVEVQGVRGHPILWQIAKERLVDELARLIATEARSGAAGVPLHFELPFGLTLRGGGPSLPALELAGLSASGVIDRVDQIEGGHLILDYKLGANPGRKLRDAGATELQLPIYAAAIQRSLGGRADAAYISVREGTRSRTLSAALGEPAANELLERGLEARFAELGAQVRSGTFTVAPVDESRCLFCAYRTACRVVRRELEEEVT